jgi:hypothetical protein
MLDYARPTPALPLDCKALAVRMLSVPVSIDSDIVGDTKEEYEAVKPVGSDTVSAGAVAGAGAGVDKWHLVTSTALTQLTVNEYLPGQGIAKHLGTLCVSMAAVTLQ